MARSQFSSNQHSRLLWRVVILALVVGATFLKPRVERWLDQAGNTNPVDVRQEEAPDPGERAARSVSGDSTEQSTTSAASPASGKPDSPEAVESSDPPGAEAPTDIQPGRLTEIRPDVFKSAAGLIYLPGRGTEHRIEHVMQHAVDQPEKPVHGVFAADGQQNAVLAMIDQAWLHVGKNGDDVRTQKQGDRTVHTVNMNRPVGYVGGREGRRQNHPQCRFIRIVVEQNNQVITAYPTKSF